MSRCYYAGNTGKGNTWYGDWVCSASMPDNLVQFCRKAFGKRWGRFWIDPLYFDDKYMMYTQKFFSEVGCELYPKLTKLPKREPDMSDDEYRAIVWGIVHDDIVAQRDTVKPICIIIKGVRWPNGKQKVVSVKEVPKVSGHNRSYFTYWR